jgi:AP-4 complex subunit mu-1
MFISIYL